MNAMKVLQNYAVPTGNILVVEGTKGKLELVSLGDYGREHNVKADFLGLSRDIEKVEHSTLQPLSEKWVVTISTQYGCYMGCRFCDVPRVGPGRNATYGDMLQQIKCGLAIHPDIRETKRLNIHYARMGEPTFNYDVLRLSIDLKHELAPYIGQSTIHPVVSTMLPSANRLLGSFLREWCAVIKNDVFAGEAGLQLSINSTNDEERTIMFNGNALPLSEVGKIAASLPAPIGRKYTLNFAVAGYEIDPNILLRYFAPSQFIVKLTPMHKTHTARLNSIKTDGDYTTIYPYKQYEAALKAAGYDVLVFITSEYEDLGRITCGNAILSGTLPDCPYEELEAAKRRAANAGREQQKQQKEV